jgi:hypothetical protein
MSVLNNEKLMVPSSFLLIFLLIDKMKVFHPTNLPLRRPHERVLFVIYLLGGLAFTVKADGVHAESTLITVRFFKTIFTLLSFSSWFLVSSLISLSHLQY